MMVSSHRRGERGYVLVPKTLPVLPPTTPQANPLVERQRELDLAEKMLNRHGVLALQGIAGSGKSALASALSERVNTQVLWIEFAPGLSDDLETLLWQLARPLATLMPGTWRSLHHIEQAGWRYPPLVRLQIILDAYARNREDVLLCIDRIERCTDIGLKSLLVALAYYIAHTQHTRLKLILIGRALPYELLRFALPPLSGLSTAAIATLAQERGAVLSAEQITLLAQQTEGLPLAITTYLALLSPSQLPADALSLSQPVVQGLVRYMLDDLSAQEREALAWVALHSQQAQATPFHVLERFESLEQRGLLTFTGQTARLHPLLRSYYDRVSNE